MCTNTTMHSTRTHPHYTHAQNCTRTCLLAHMQITPHHIPYAHARNIHAHTLTLTLTAHAHGHTRTQPASTLLWTMWQRILLVRLTTSLLLLRALEASITRSLQRCRNAFIRMCNRRKYACHSETRGKEERPCVESCERERHERNRGEQGRRLWMRKHR